MEGKKYLFPEDYMADPAAHVFNGKLYIYPSHDWEAGAEEDDDGGHFQMKDYHALSFDDLENGKRYTFSKDGKPGPVSKKLYDTLRGIQYGEIEDKHGWTTVVIE